MFATVATALLVAIPVSGQTPPSSSAKSLDVPRTSDAKPNLQGFWRIMGGEIMGTYSIERGQSDQDALLCVVGNNTAIRGPSFVVDPADGIVPYQPWAAAI